MIRRILVISVKAYENAVDRNLPANRLLFNYPQHDLRDILMLAAPAQQAWLFHVAN